jgi:hypothetical protein
MGQCSTLPAEGRTAISTKRGDSMSLGRDESLSHRQKDKFSPKSPHVKRNSFLQVQTQDASHQPVAQFSHMQNETIQPQARNPEQAPQYPEPMEEDSPREDIPQPPEVAVRTRCYKLNLDSDINPQTLVLGPFADTLPPLTCSSSDDSSTYNSSTQVVVRTAKIFRGITVAKDGTILTQNARATRSSRGAQKKIGEKSRQATKIDQAKDLVEESILTGKVSANYIFMEESTLSRHQLTNDVASFKLVSSRLLNLTSPQI